MGTILSFLLGLFIGFISCTIVVVLLFDDSDGSKHLQ